ncbi:hypothetical protein ACR3K2_04890 [Cryptosporidium serpentis]
MKLEQHVIYLTILLYLFYQIGSTSTPQTAEEEYLNEQFEDKVSNLNLVHFNSKYSGLVPKHEKTSSSFLYGLVDIYTRHLVYRKTKSFGPLRYGLNSDDMHITLYNFVNNIRFHIPTQKTYLHERQNKARKLRRRYLYWLWHRWRYLMTAKERMPILVQDIDLTILPIDPLERVFSYAIDIIELPAPYYLELVYCMYQGIRPYINGLLASYSLQDLIGASLYSIGSNSKFRAYYCNQAVNMWSDDQIVPNAESICSIMSTCLEKREFKNKISIKPLVETYIQKIDDLYQKKKHIGADTARKYAINAFFSITKIFHHFQAHKRPDYIEKLFVIVRAARYMIYANELLLRSGFKKKPIFKSEFVSDLIQYTIYRTDPVSMMRYCIKYSLLERFKLRKKMGIAIIEEACAHTLSFGFIDDTGKLPSKFTRAQARQIVNRHFNDLQNTHGNNSSDLVILKPEVSSASIDDKGSIDDIRQKIRAIQEEIVENQEDANNESISIDIVDLDNNNEDNSNIWDKVIHQEFIE